MRSLETLEKLLIRWRIHDCMFDLRMLIGFLHLNVSHHNRHSHHGFVIYPLHSQMSPYRAPEFVPITASECSDC